MMKYWSQHSPILTIRGINLMLAEARAHNLGGVTSAYGIPEETIGRPEMRFTVDTEQEADGRWTAKISGPVPAESVYGATREEAVNKARDAMRKAYETAPREQTKFTEWGIVFERGTICSAVEQPEKNKDGGVLHSRMIAKVQPNPAKQRDTENICGICRRKFKEHSDPEFAVCWKELMIEHDIWQISHPEPNYAYGPVVLMRAIHHLREMYGKAQEAAAIELLSTLERELLRES